MVDRQSLDNLGCGILERAANWSVDTFHLRLTQAKICELDREIIRSRAFDHQNILRFNIEMDDAFAVDAIESAKRLYERSLQELHLAPAGGHACEIGKSVFTLYILHRIKVPVEKAFILEIPYGGKIKHLDEIRMRQARKQGELFPEE